MLIFKFSTKILRKCDFDFFLVRLFVFSFCFVCLFVCLFVCKIKNGSGNIHKKIQVHNTNIYGLGAKKQISRGGPHPHP